jgi:hypothetical protein
MLSLVSVLVGSLRTSAVSDVGCDPGCGKQAGDCARAACAACSACATTSCVAHFGAADAHNRADCKTFCDHEGLMCSRCACSACDVCGARHSAHAAATAGCKGDWCAQPLSLLTPASPSPSRSPPVAITPLTRQVRPSLPRRPLPERRVLQLRVLQGGSARGGEWCERMRFVVRRYRHSRVLTSHVLITNRDAISMAEGHLKWHRTPHA